jgi:hypothetical protein
MVENGRKWSIIVENGRKWSEIAENCDHNIDPSFFQVHFQPARESSFLFTLSEDIFDVTRRFSYLLLTK